MKRVVVYYSGHVQGVGFRFNAIAQAQGLMVTGFVRNESDGSVMMDVQGSSEDVNKLLDRIQRSMTANIEDTQIDRSDPVPSRDRFTIR